MPSMKTILLSLSPTLRLVLLCAFAAAALVGCATNDTNDTYVYPTPAEKNRDMQERLGQMTRSFQ